MIAQNVQWHLYDSYNNAIGQGYNDYTPLQLANYVATLVNGGIRYQPYIVDKIVDPLTGKTIQQNNPTVINHVSVLPDILATVKQAMSEVTSGGGTANFLLQMYRSFQEEPRRVLLKLDQKIRLPAICITACLWPLRPMIILRLRLQVLSIMVNMVEIRQG